MQLFSKLNQTQKALLALVLILPASSIGVYSSLYLSPIHDVLTHEIEIGKGIWTIAKIWLYSLPVCWLLFVDKGKLSWSPTSGRGVIAGFLSTIPVVAVLLGVFFLMGTVLIKTDATEQIGQLGLASPVNFIIFATAMSLGNSMMEEYVWRWFVFSKFKVLVGVWPAIVLSAIFFTGHHVIIAWKLGTLQFVILASVGLFVGGIIWGWLYNKYNSIWPGWICHVAADATIMWITWQIITS